MFAIFADFISFFSYAIRSGGFQPAEWLIWARNPYHPCLSVENHFPSHHECDLLCSSSFVKFENEYLLEMSLT